MAKRKKFTWIPTLGTTSESGNSSSSFDFAVQPLAGTGSNFYPVVSVSALVRDEPVLSQETTILNDIIGNEWFLERIVGKIQAGCYGPEVSPPTGDGRSFVRLTCGFFVAACDDTDTTRPRGDVDLVDFDPRTVDNIRQPWIWRRTWVLQNNGNVGEVGGEPIFPSTTVGYGSVADGPHVDAKSVRRVHQEERLWFVAAAELWPLSTGSTDVDFTPYIRGNLDVRVLGALRKAQNKSTF